MVKLPPATLPVAVIVVPLLINPVASTAPPVVMFPPSTLPVAVIVVEPAIAPEAVTVTEINYISRLLKSKTGHPKWNRINQTPQET